MDHAGFDLHSGAYERFGSKGNRRYPQGCGQQHGLGRSRGGLTTKLHLVCDALGNALRFVLSPGQHADIRYGPRLIEGLCTGAVIADRGYDARTMVDQIEAMGAVAVIPSRRTNREQRVVDWNLYADRNKVERLIGRLKGFRRVATRYEKTEASFLAFVHLAATILWLQ